MRVQMNVQDVPTAVRDAVENDARERDVSVNDVQGEILAGYYDMAWESSGYPFPKGPDLKSGSDQWVIRMPAKLKGMLRDHARTAGIPAQVLILRIIERHYGLNITPARKRSYQLTNWDPELIREARERHAGGESIRSISRDLPRHSGRSVHRKTLTKALGA